MFLIGGFFIFTASTGIGLIARGFGWLLRLKYSIILLPVRLLMVPQLSVMRECQQWFLADYLHKLLRGNREPKNPEKEIKGCDGR